MSRYNSRTQATNTSEMYEKIFDDRGVKYILQYKSPVLRYPTDEELKKIKTFDYAWKQGDKFWRLASQYYGDPKMWWVIAQFNQKPTESHLKIGEVIKIPTELAMVLGVLG